MKWGVYTNVHNTLTYIIRMLTPIAFMKQYTTKKISLSDGMTNIMLRLPSPVNVFYKSVKPNIAWFTIFFFSFLMLQIVKHIIFSTM
jgi:hypothetical protein